ncbi:MAG: hypothetical protein FAF03_09775 [Epsilonproteobacteria bacterium]|nr:hypothetical protein [Campylobacterota bacterium]
MVICKWLNDILEEISTETGAPKPSQLKQKNLRKINYFLKPCFFIIAIVFSLFIVVLSNLVTDATKEVKSTPKIVTSSPENTEDWKMPEDRIESKKTSVPHVIELTPVHKKMVQKKPIKVESVKPKPKIKKKTERELAKEALRLQMLQ